MKGIIAIVLKVDKDKEGSRSYDGGQYDTEKEINHSLKGDPLFSASPGSMKKAQDKTNGDKEPVSINVQTAQAKKDWKHSSEFRVRLPAVQVLWQAGSSE